MASLMEELRGSLDEVLFLKFRETCPFLDRTVIIPGQLVARECKHPEFKFPVGKTGGGLPNCYRSGCPIFERLVQKVSAEWQCDEFLDRWEKL